MYWLFHNVPQQPENLQINVHLMWLNRCALLDLSASSPTRGLPTSWVLFFPLPVPEGQDTASAPPGGVAEHLKWGELSCCQCPGCAQHLSLWGGSSTGRSKEGGLWYCPEVHLHPELERKQTCEHHYPGVLMISRAQGGCWILHIHLGSSQGTLGKTPFKVRLCGTGLNPSCLTGWGRRIVISRSPWAI